jgi:hypothetical protein
MMRQIVVVLMLVVGVAAAELPVREVVLFKHGVGYFARSGRLGAGESARLDFKAGEMNDVLKSLTIEQKGPGKFPACATIRASHWRQSSGSFHSRSGVSSP